MPRFGHLGSASDTPSRVGTALDPMRWPACAGALGPRAARRLLQLNGPADTTPDFPDPSVLCGAKAPRAGRCRLRTSHTSRALTAQELQRHNCTATTSTSASCADTDLPQVDPPGHLLSLPDVNCDLENGCTRRPAGYRPLRRLLSKPLEDQLASHASIRGPQRAPQGRHLQPLAKATAAGRTQGTFHLRDLFVDRWLPSSNHRPRLARGLPRYRPRGRAPCQLRSSRGWPDMLRHLFYPPHTVLTGSV